MVVKGVLPIVLELLDGEEVGCSAESYYPDRGEPYRLGRP
jgi:hypothetical protein